MKILRMTAKVSMTETVMLCSSWISVNRFLCYRLLTLFLWLGGWLTATAGIARLLDVYTRDGSWVWGVSIGLMMIAFGGIATIKDVFTFGIGVMRPEDWFTGKGMIDQDDDLGGE
jgi:hypothetical protein